MKTYVAFIDFAKAFDSIDRSILFEKLQILGIPGPFCTLLNFILSNLEFQIRNNDILSPKFYSSKGTPQGDPLSPLLFALYISDLPDYLHSLNVYLPKSNFKIPCLLYADDTALISDSHQNLQIALHNLSSYCKINKLSINISKSKILIFHKGRLPNSVSNFSFHINSSELEIVKEFKYLGIIFTNQLSFTTHLSNCIIRARSKIAFLFHALPLKFLSLSVLLKIFRVFIFPIFSYGSHIWVTSSFSKNVANSVNSVFTKFLKRYLCIPQFSCNSIVHFLTNTFPLMHSLLSFTISSSFKACFPVSLSNFRFQFLNSFPPLPKL